jgi:hypothetical protein
MKIIYKKKINLNTGWTKVELSKGVNDFYIVAQKYKKGSKSDTILKDDVKRIRFEVAIDGIAKKTYLTTNYITVDFDMFSSSDTNINTNTAIVKVLHYPSKFYIKPIEITDASGNVKKEGKTTISVGINSLRLS